MITTWGGKISLFHYLEGGNVVGPKTKAILTDKIYRENPGWLRPNLQAKLRKLLHVDQLIVVPREPFDPIGHVDAMVRFVDEQNDLHQLDYRQSMFRPAFRLGIEDETGPLRGGRFQQKFGELWGKRDKTILVPFLEFRRNVQ